MCGINLIISNTDKIGERELERMLVATNHRGPDDTGIYKHIANNEKILLGHNRLMVMDNTERGAQPMITRCGNYVIIFNGEIYNYKQLYQKHLEPLKIPIYSKSDTEVLLYLLKHKGLDILPELNGMFAFILIDKTTNCCYLVRDRHGIKPLYYSQTHQAFLASSEIKGLLATWLIGKNINKNQIEAYVKFRHSISPQTLIDGVSELEPGCLIAYQNGKFKLSQWANIQPTQPNVGTLNEQSEELLSALDEALLTSMPNYGEAAVPIGLLLSGGIDSALIAAYINKANLTNITAFTAVPSKTPFSSEFTDEYFADKASVQFGLNHKKITYDSSVIRLGTTLATRSDLPIADPTALLNYTIANNARKLGNTVLISGTGGDELFAGYNRIWAFKQYLNLAFNIPPNLLDVQLPKLPDAQPHPLRNAFRLLNKLSTGISKDPLQTWLNFVSVAGSQELNFLQPSGFEQLHQNAPKGTNANDWLNWAIQFDRVHYLKGNLLMQADQTSMLHGIEVRLPFLDNRLTDLIYNLPASTLLGARQKWIGKSLLEAHNGKIYTQRKKEGFGLPISYWLRNSGNIKELFPEVENKHNPIFEVIEYKSFENVIQDFIKEKNDYGHLIWNVCQLLTYANHF